MGYRRDPAPLPNEPVLVPGTREPDPEGGGYLAWEVQFLTEGSAVARVALALLVIGFFMALAAF